MRCSRWKLHLRPKHLSSAHIKDKDIPPLPRGKSVVDVLKDFIEYLFQCAERYIQESHPRYIWLSVKDDIQFIFTHPNGWEGAQQQKIRRAIELAGLVPSTPDGRARVRFLTEGEAGLHFCIWDLFASGIPDQEQYPEGQGVVVIDAGGGTIDLSMYSMKLNPTSFDEIAPAECKYTFPFCDNFPYHVFRPSPRFSLRYAKSKGTIATYAIFLLPACTLTSLETGKLQGSRYSSPEMIDDITNTFDQTTKLHICNAEQPAYIKVGSLRENALDHGIKAGRLRLSG